MAVAFVVTGPARAEAGSPQIEPVPAQEQSAAESRQQKTAETGSSGQAPVRPLSVPAEAASPRDNDSSEVHGAPNCKESRVFPGSPSLDALDSDYAGTADSASRSALTLYEAEERALSNSPSIRSSRYSAMVSHEQLGQWLKNIYPTLSFTAGFSHSGTLNSSSSSTIMNPDAGQPVTVSSGGGNSRSRVSVGLSASQTLFDLSRRPRLRKAELSEASALADLESEKQKVLLNVRKAWFACYMDQTQLDIALDTVNNKQLRVHEAEQHYKTGVKAKSDVVSAEADLAAARHDAVQAQTRLLTDWVALNAAMGIQNDEPYRLVLDPYWEKYVKADSQSLIDTAFAYRPELQRLQAQLRSALTELDIIHADGLPTLGATASLGGSGSLTPFEGTWSVGLNLNWSLFDGYMRKYEESAQKLQARAAAENFEAERLQIYQEVKSAEVALSQSEASIASAEAALAAAQEKYRLASARYKVGISDLIEVSDAELSLAQARYNCASAMNDLRLAKAEMIKALGVDDMDNLPSDSEKIVLDPLPEMPELYDDGTSEKNPEYDFPRSGEEK